MLHQPMIRPVMLIVTDCLTRDLALNSMGLVIQECMQMSGWQTLMRTAVLCSRAEYFIDQHPMNRQRPLGEWCVR